MKRQVCTWLVICLTFAGSVRAASKAKPSPALPQAVRAALLQGQTAPAADYALQVWPGGKAEAGLEALSRAVAGRGTTAAKLVGELASRGPVGRLAAADLLWRLAVDGKLTDAQADVAAGMLMDEDPFVAALAEWALATRVGLDNGGRDIVWPRENPPAWFAKWQQWGGQNERMVAADYARLAIGWGLQRQTGGIIASGRKFLARGRAAAKRALTRAGTAQATRDLIHRQLRRAEDLLGQLAAVAKGPRAVVERHKLYIQLRLVLRPVVLASAPPAASLVFVKRHPAHSHRNITGSQYPWVHKPGGGIYVQQGLGSDARLREVLAGRLGPGHVHGIDLHWDAGRVVFGWARQKTWPPPRDPVRGNDVFVLRGLQEPTHIFEADLAPGGRIRQLTDHRYWSDLEPTYLPDDGVAFASDRSGRSSECGRFSADHTVINLYAVDADGRGLRRLSDNKDIDRHPHTLSDGLIAYTRWEYQERHFLEVHAAWTVRPDGTMSDAIFNQHMRAPYGLRDIRSVPRSDRLVAVATGHHTFAYGPIVLLDTSAAISSPAAIERVTPYVSPQEGPMAGQASAEGGVPDGGGLYQTPWALSDKQFLASYSYARPASDSQGGRNSHGFALYLLDVDGNKELLHRDLVYSCAFPMPLRKRGRPPVVPKTAPSPVKWATCYVGDVYYDLPGVPRGTVKYLRIAQRVGWPLDDSIGAMRWIPGNAWERRVGFYAWAPVRVIGTVAVEADGSAHFRVPADAGVYFQALDEHFMEIRRMRSHVTFQPGETRGCLGCHESKLKPPAASWRVTRALRRRAEMPTPPAWGADRLLGYEWLVQPIFDKHCVRCHGGKAPKAGLVLTGEKAEDGFARSFHSLFPPKATAKGAKGTAPAMPLVWVSNRFSGASVTRPMEFGSHRSRLIHALRTGTQHRKVALSPAEWQALVTWIDANAPYYDTFFNRRPGEGRPLRRDICPRLPLPLAGRLPAH